MNIFPRTGSSGRFSGTVAFTLFEMILALGLGSMVLAVAAAFTVYTARSFVATANYADLDAASRHAVDLMTRDIRQAKTLTSFATNQVVFTDVTNGTFSYTWDPGAATLTRIYNGQSSVILTSCDYLTFHIAQRTPSNNFTFWAATATTNAKLVDVSWNCSRQIVGQKVNTESIQTAKITLRN